MNIKQNLKKMPLFFRSKIGIFDMFLKRLCKDGFGDLQLNSNWKFQTRAALSHKMAALKIFCEITQKSFFSPVIVKGAVSGLRQFLATESPWKIMKNTFYFILTNWICYCQIRFWTYYAFSWTKCLIFVKFENIGH